MEVETPKTPKTPKRKRGRPKKGEVVAKPESRRLERQVGQTLPQMLADIPTCCNVGSKEECQRAYDKLDRL